MSFVNGSFGSDFIHRSGDGRAPPAGFNDVVGVTAGDDVVNGYGDGDRLFGDGGNDRLDGGNGNDVLDDGGGAGAFFLDTAFDRTKNVDVIRDFKAGDDLIALRSSIFKGLAPAGELKAAFFKDLGAPGAKADKDDRILYESGTGNQS